MKLEPVYRVGPPPTPKTVASRRAFLLASCAAVGGGIAGVASGFLLRAPAPTTANQKDQPPEDKRLVWLREQCDDSTPIETLLRHRVVLMQYLRDFQEDPMIWHGIERLGREIVGNRDLPDRRRLALELSGFLEHAPTAIGFDARLLLSELRSVAGGR
jgi:hypothetical protein